MNFQYQTGHVNLVYSYPMNEWTFFNMRSKFIWVEMLLKIYKNVQCLCCYYKEKRVGE